MSSIIEYKSKYIELSLNINLVKKSQIAYQIPDQQKEFVFCLSKVYLEKLDTKYLKQNKL